VFSSGVQLRYLFCGKSLVSAQDVALAIIPKDGTDADDQACSELKRVVGNMDQEGLKSFLSFTTSASNLIPGESIDELKQSEQALKQMIMEAEPLRKRPARSKARSHCGALSHGIAPLPPAAPKPLVHSKSKAAFPSPASPAAAKAAVAKASNPHSSMAASIASLFVLTGDGLRYSLPLELSQLLRVSPTSNATGFKGVSAASTKALTASTAAPAPAPAAPAPASQQSGKHPCRKRYKAQCWSCDTRRILPSGMTFATPADAAQGYV
jgi:hypothetical protein